MREMRRQDRKLIDEETKRILAEGEYGILATVMENNVPYSVPISYAFDEGTNAIYMHCTVDGGQKIDNILANPRVCFTVVSGTEMLPQKFATRYYSANVFGEIEIVEETEAKKYGLYQLIKKYSPNYEEAGLKYIDAAVDKVFVLKLCIEEMSGKARK
ncbi:MAG: pyridoxamine 5'-phosphate oxidase family protein [Lachnospiraceae bacterium]|nr:pyridoxamine 5'-phosphate oxidase family protein [Lachnospiraceae bacterium]